MIKLNFDFCCEIITLNKKTGKIESICTNRPAILTKCKKDGFTQISLFICNEHINQIINDDVIIHRKLIG